MQERGGRAPEPLQESPKPRGLTKRRFLKGAAAIGGVALTAGIAERLDLLNGLLGSGESNPRPTVSPKVDQSTTATPITPETQPNSHTMVTLEKGELVRDGKPFGVYGTNCYPLISNGIWGGPVDPEIEIKAAAQQGMNVLRYWDFAELTDNGKDFSLTKKLLTLAEQKNMLLYPTLTNQWANGDRSIPAKDKKFYQSVVEDFTTYKNGGKLAEDGFLNYAKTTARELKGNTNVLALQGFNEAEYPDPTLLVQVAEALTTVIKEEDPDRLVSFGVLGSGQPGLAGSNFETLMQECDIVDFHIYPSDGMSMSNGLLGDQWNGVAVRMQQASDLGKYGKPVIVSEIGIPNDSIDLTKYNETIENLLRDRNFAGLCSWDLQTPTFNSNDTFQYIPDSKIGKMYRKFRDKLIDPRLRPTKS